jgi:hypothetical protein
MSLPTPTDLLGLDYSFRGRPLIILSSKSSISLSGLDFAFKGQPLMSNYASTPTGWAHKINGVSPGKVNGIARASISKINGK